MEKKKMKLWKKLLIIFVSIIMVIGISFIGYKAYWHIDKDRKYKEFEKIPTIETTGTLSYIEDENCAKVENMDYITQDGIGVKVDSISLLDDTLYADIIFKFDKEFDYTYFGYGYAIYDENQNIYQISSRMHIGEMSKYDYYSLFMQQELGIYNDKDIYSRYLSDSSGYSNEMIAEKIIKNKLRIDARDTFPLSQKIYIKIFDLGYHTVYQDENKAHFAENTNLSNAKWLFVLDIPEEMNKRNTINLRLANEIPGLTITKMTLTEAKLVLNFNSEEYINLISAGKDMKAGEFLEKCREMLYISDAEGNVYQELGGGTTGEENGYKISFDATQNDLNKTLFINFKVGDNQYKSALIASNK